MFSAVPLVTGIFSLVAFVAAIGLLAYRAKLNQNSALLRSTNSETKLEALARIVRTYKIGTTNLTKEQQFVVAGKELDLHASRQLLFAILAGLIAVILAVVAIAYFMSQSNAGDQTTTGTASPAVSNVQGDVKIDAEVTK